MGQSALVLDFGGPVLLTPFEVVARQPGTPTHALLHERGPLAPPDRPDLIWEDLQAGRITERDYWDARSVEWHALGGHGADIRAMVAHLYEPARHELVRAQAYALVADAKATGIPIAVLTNDMRAFHTEDWIARMEILHDIDLIVDGSVEGHLKPHPRLYQLLSERLGVALPDMVFLDDQTTNINGANALGIPSVWFDVTDPDVSYQQVRKLLGMEESGGRAT